MWESKAQKSAKYQNDFIFRLKEKPDQNIAPKLVRQLVYDPKVQQDMKDLAQQVIG